MSALLQFTSNFAVDTGEFSPGAKVSFFLSGTMTAVTVYQDEALTTPHPTPVVANASGRFPDIWAAGTSRLKAIVTDADGATIDTFDPVTINSASLDVANFGVTATAAELNVLDGCTATTAELNILDGVTATAAELNVLDGITATVTELNYTDGVTSNIQTQLDGKAPSESLSTSLPSAVTSVNQAIPANVTEIKVTTLVLSLSGTDNILVQIGTGSAPLTSGYISTSSVLAATVSTTSNATGFHIPVGNAAKEVTGNLTLTRLVSGGTEWAAHWTFRTNTTELVTGSGALTLSGAIDIVRVRSSGTNTFDAGRLAFTWT